MAYNIDSNGNSERRGGMEYISPMVDVIFKKMFSREENKDMLRGLVKAFLEVDIGNDFKIAGNDLPPENPDEKFSRIDLHASSNVGEVDIEVQVGADSNFVQRFVNYSMQLYTSSVKRSDAVYKPRPVFGLGICANNVLPKSTEWFSENMLMGTKSHLPLLDNFKICFVELNKVRSLVSGKNVPLDNVFNDERMAWAMYFLCRREEQFNMLKEHTTIAEVQKAVDVLSSISTDPEMQELARSRLNNEIYKQSALSAAKDEGRAEGRAEERAKMVQALRDIGIDESAIDEAIKRTQGTQGNIPAENKTQQDRQEPQAPRKSPPKHGRR